MIIVEEVLNKLVRDSVNLILGISDYAIKAKQKDAPRPKGSYADVDSFNLVVLGWEQTVMVDRSDTDPEDLDLDATNEGLRELTMSLGFYRDSAVDNSVKAHIGFTRESIQQLFSAAGVGLASRTGPIEISEVVDDGYEERAQFDIVLNVVGSDTDIVRSIQSVDMAAVFESRGLSFNFNIEVP